MIHTVTEMVGFLEQVGIKIVLFIAGFVGGLSSVDRRKDFTFWQKMTSLLSGGFSANYLTPVISDWLNLRDSTLYGVAFLVGYGGLKFVEIIYIRFSKLTKTTNEDDNRKEN